MRILIVTDAWHPQVNGVARTLARLETELVGLGNQVSVLSPADFSTVPLPFYREVGLALVGRRRIARWIEAARPDAIHIATEGPLGFQARRYCLRRGIPFTTSYHTKFPEFLRARLPVPLWFTYACLRRFHNAGAGILVATPSLAADLAARGFARLRPWTRGVDTALFNPAKRMDLGLPRPVFLNVGRVAIEKNLEAFLDLDLPGSKLVVGDGPDLERLRRRYPDVHFTGLKTGEDLARIYASADVFVFQSRVDTFGNVLIEAMASGCPVAAFPVTGPVDIVRNGVDGVLSGDLRAAALAAVNIPRDAARQAASRFSWTECASQFVEHLLPAPSSTRTVPSTKEALCLP